MRINQEMLILNPSQTTFIIISSDQDFRQHIQLLSNASFEVIVIHNAMTEQWRAAIEMYASQAYLWNDIMNLTATSLHDSANTTSYSNNTIQLHSPTSICRNKVSEMNNHQLQLISNPQSHHPTSNPNSSYKELRDFEKEALCVGWRVAVCLRWKSAFGFLLVDISHPTVEESFTISSTTSTTAAINTATNNSTDTVIDDTNSNNTSNMEIQTTNGFIPIHMQINRFDKNNLNAMKVYIHNSVLTYKSNTQRMLQTGEYVLVFIQISEKGPKAVLAKNIYN